MENANYKGLLNLDTESIKIAEFYAPASKGSQINKIFHNLQGIYYKNSYTMKGKNIKYATYFTIDEVSEGYKKYYENLKQTSISIEEAILSPYKKPMSLKETRRHLLILLAKFYKNFYTNDIVDEFSINNIITSDNYKLISSPIYFVDKAIGSIFMDYYPSMNCPLKEYNFSFLDKSGGDSFKKILSCFYTKKIEAIDEIILPIEQTILSCSGSNENTKRVIVDLMAAQIILSVSLFKNIYFAKPYKNMKKHYHVKSKLFMTFYELEGFILSPYYKNYKLKDLPKFGHDRIRHGCYRYNYYFNKKMSSNFKVKEEARFYYLAPPRLYFLYNSDKKHNLSFHISFGRCGLMVYNDNSSGTACRRMHYDEFVVDLK